MDCEWVATDNSFPFPFPPKGNPESPKEARDAGVPSEVVMVHLTVDELGQLTDLNVVDPVGMGFDEAAIASIKFLPATKAGKLIAASENINVSFCQAYPCGLPSPIDLRFWPE